MRNAVSEINKALGVDRQKGSFIGVVSTVGPNGITVLAGDREELVRADGVWHVGDEVIVEGSVVVGMIEKRELTVWID